MAEKHKLPPGMRIYFGPPGRATAMGAITHFKGGLLAGLALCAVPAFAEGPQIDAENPSAPEERSSASSFEATWTHFGASAAAGDSSSAIVYGAKLDGYATVDGRDLRLWDGFTINAHAEFVYGHNANNLSSVVLLPVTTALTAQIVDPVKKSAKTAAFLGLRTLVRF